MEWQSTGSHIKSNAEMDRLVETVLLHPEFRLEDLQSFSARREVGRLDEHIAVDEATDTTGAIAEDAWREGSVTLSMPKERHRWAAHGGEAGAPTYEVKQVWYRPLLGIIKAAFQDSSASKFHWAPFELLWNKPNAPAPERLYSELYNTGACLDAHEKLLQEPRHPDDPPGLEYVIAPLLFFSDSTHLTNFGTAALWPIYTYLGCLSKYARAAPSAFAAHHTAYIPSVCTHLSSQDIY